MYGSSFLSVPEPSRFEKRADGCGSKAFAKGGYHAACDEYELLSHDCDPFRKNVTICSPVNKFLPHPLIVGASRTLPLPLLKDSERHRARVMGPHGERGCVVHHDQEADIAAVLFKQIALDLLVYLFYGLYLLGRLPACDASSGASAWM